MRTAGVDQGLLKLIKDLKMESSSSEELNPVEKQAASAAAPAQAAIPEGTVISDGKLKINLARPDARLLHGQVATADT